MYNIPNGSVVKFTGNPAVYLVDGNSLRHFLTEVKTKAGTSIFNYMVELPITYKQGFSAGPDISANIPFDPPAPTWKNNITTISTSSTSTPTPTSTTPISTTPISTTPVAVTPSAPSSNGKIPTYVYNGEMYTLSGDGYVKLTDNEIYQRNLQNSKYEQIPLPQDGKQISSTNVFGKTTIIRPAGSTPTSTTPEIPAGTQPMTTLTDADRDRLNKMIDNYVGLDGQPLNEADKLFIKSVFVDSDTYTQGHRMPTNAELSQIIADATTNAHADIDPYYQRITPEELADYKQNLANIRAKAQNFQANEENTYQQKLADTKQQLRARGLTFSGTAIKNVGRESAIGAPSNYEGSLQAARRLDYEGSNMALGQQAQALTTAAEQRLGSVPVQGVLAGTGGLTTPTAGNYNVGALTNPFATTVGTYSGTGSMAPTIAQEQAAAIRESRNQRLQTYKLTF